MTTRVANRVPHEELSFVSVNKTSPHYPRFEKIFNEQVVPIHGEQSRTLRKLGDDRRAELLMLNGQAVAALVYKRKRQKVQPKHSYPGGLEVKNIVIINGASPSATRWTAMILERVKKLAQRINAKHAYVVLSSRFPCLESLETAGFEKTRTWTNNQVERVIDNLYVTAIAPLGYVSTPSKTVQAAAAAAGRRMEKRGRSGVDQSQLGRPEQKRVGVIQSVRSRRDSYAGPGSGVRRPSSGLQQGPRAHRVTLKMKYLQQILSGRKTIEGRINSGMMLRFKAGETVTFFSGRTEAVCNIIAIRKHASFRDMLEKEGVQRCLTDVTDVDVGAAIYHRIPSYTQRAAQHGVLAIEIQLKR